MSKLLLLHAILGLISLLLLCLRAWRGGYVRTNLLGAAATIATGSILLLTSDKLSLVRCGSLLLYTVVLFISMGRKEKTDSSKI